MPRWSNHLVVDEIVSQVNGKRRWLYISINKATHEILYYCLFQSRIKQLAVQLQYKLCE
jgi:transposase-like protein